MVPPNGLAVALAQGIELVGHVAHQRRRPRHPPPHVVAEGIGVVAGDRAVGVVGVGPGASAADGGKLVAGARVTSKLSLALLHAKARYTQGGKRQDLTLIR